MGLNTTEPAWTIIEWSRVLGRGAIRSEHLGRLDFDAACAEVDDFRSGEHVNVELERIGSEYRVRRIWPSDLRLSGREAEALGTPSLERSIETAFVSALAAKRPCLDYRVRSLAEDRLTLEGDDDLFAYGHEDVLEIAGVKYVSMPTEFGCQSIRLATMVERAHVAERVELTAADAVLTFVEDESRFHFVVGSGLRWWREA